MSIGGTKGESTLLRRIATGGSFLALIAVSRVPMPASASGSRHTVSLKLGAGRRCGPGSISVSHAFVAGKVDSELGALRLLKWKVKMASLDVIAASKKTNAMDPADAEELSPHVEDEVADDLIRADEAAVVQLALSKLDS